MITIFKIARTLAFAAAIVTFTQSAWGRVILTNDDARVTVDDSFNCNSEKSSIRIESTAPQIFEGQSKRMQTLIDSTQAILRYECPKLNELQIAGYMLGIDQPVYSGVAAGRNYWQVNTKRVISVKEAEQATKAIESNPEEYAEVLGTNRQIAIATINLDMTVDAVAQRINDVFGSQPAYEPVTGIMNQEIGGCPENYYSSSEYITPNENWTCLKAWFTDRRIAKLYRLGYTQVSKNDVTSIRNALINHFGTPVVDKKKKKQHRLAWEAETKDNADRTTTEQLIAKLWQRNNLVIIDLFLEDPDLAEQYVNENEPDVKNIDLKL